MGNKEIMRKTGKPILSIVTRHWTARPESFERCRESISHFNQQKIQHFVTYDEVGLGYKKSCQLVVDCKSEVIGDYVWLLDDDDYQICDDLPEILEQIKIEHNPDIIIGRIASHGKPCYAGKIFPRDSLWNKKDLMAFKIHEAGLPLLIMKNSIFQEYIHNIALRNDHDHDWDIVEAWQRDMPQRKFKVYFLDKVLSIQRYKEGQAKMIPNWQVVSYYTRDSIYEKITHRLMQSTAHFYIPLRVYSYPSKGNWFLNLHLKPDCILRAMDEFPNKNILYTDGDSFFRKYPSLLNNYEYDLACVWLKWWEMQPQKYEPGAAKKREKEEPILSAGTIWLKNKPEVRKYVEDWKAMLMANPTLFEQDGLNMTYKRAQLERKIKVADSFPPEYCMVCLPDPSHPGKMLPVDESVPYNTIVIEHGRSTDKMIKSVK